MSSFIAVTMLRLFAPRHELSCSWWTWRALVRGLRARGRGVRESGAFLLGHRARSRARIDTFILYDDLDPNALETGIIHFDGQHYGALWEHCRRTGLTVVADVHTHPGREMQSGSDRAHPMISQAGHVALILPGFARETMRACDVGIYRYRGAKKWDVVDPADRARFFHIGI